MAKKRQKNIRLSDEEWSELTQTAADLGLPAKTGEREVILASLKLFYELTAIEQNARLARLDHIRRGFSSGQEIDQIIEHGPPAKGDSDADHFARHFAKPENDTAAHEQQAKALAQQAVKNAREQVPRPTPRQKKGRPSGSGAA